MMGRLLCVWWGGSWVGCGEGARRVVSMMLGIDLVCSGVPLLVLEVLGQAWAGWCVGQKQ